MEKWVPAFDFEGFYTVSSRGRCRSERYNPGKIMTPTSHSVGYARYSLTYDGVPRMVYAHRLIYESFNGPLSDGIQINHLDGDKRNNHINNLEAVTPKENMAHAVSLRGDWRSGRKRCPMKSLNKDLLKVYNFISSHENGVHIKIIVSNFYKVYNSMWIHSALQQIKKRGMIEFIGPKGKHGGVWRAV